MAKLEGLEDLALFRECYVIELSCGLRIGNLGSVPGVSLINYESGRVMPLLWVAVFFNLPEVGLSILKNLSGHMIQPSVTQWFKIVTPIKIY